MGRGGQGETNGTVMRKQLKEFSWKEIQQKTKPEDKCLVVDGEVYNVTEWVKRHPGGSRVINHYAGQDASDAVKAFHIDQQFIKKYMNAIHIGSVKVDEKKGSVLEEDFREVKDTAEKMGLFKASYTFFIIHLLHIIFFDWAAWAVMYYYGTGWIPFTISILCMATVTAQAGYVLHDFGHLSVLPTKLGNKIFAYISVALIKGVSPAWWSHMHYQHHSKPNVMNKDPDVRLEALFVVGEDMPVEVAKTKKKSMPYNWQNYYFPIIGPPLLFPVYFTYTVFRFVFIRKAWVDLATILIFFSKLLLIYSPMIGVGWTVFYYFAFRIMESQWFTWVSQTNHIPMEIKHDTAEPWLKLHLHATCNIEKSFFNDWFTGHLNFQIEHHLFPRMPRHNLYKIAPYIKSLCQKHNIPYTVKPLSTAFADIIRSLKHSGQLWEATYHEHHLDHH